MTKAKELVKGIVKKTEVKPSFGKNPWDQWSTTGDGGGIGLPENVTSRRADLLSRFYKSKGYNIDYVSKNQRVAQSKKGEYEKWKRDHGIYEEDEVNEDLTTKYNGPHTGAPETRSEISKSPTLKRKRQLDKAASHYAVPTPAGSMKHTMQKEDNINDPQCATQSPFDGANTTNDVASPKRTKAAKMVKEIYAKHRLKEDLYDHEKDDKGPGTDVKQPKVIKKTEVNDSDEKGTNARMILKGGTTLTGEKRDTIEIDPMLKNRSKQPDYIATNTGKKQ